MCRSPKIVTKEISCVYGAIFERNGTRSLGSAHARTHSVASAGVFMCVSSAFASSAKESKPSSLQTFLVRPIGNALIRKGSTSPQRLKIASKAERWLGELYTDPLDGWIDQP